MHAIGDTWTAVFLTLLFIWGLPLLPRYREMGMTMPSQSFPFWPFWLVFLIGIAMYAITCYIQAYSEWRRLEEPQVPGGEHE